MARSRKPSASQLELLREMAAGYDRHIIYNPYALRTSWAREPGKRQIQRSTVRALETLGCLTDRDGSTGWWLTDKGRGLAEQHNLFEARA